MIPKRIVVIGSDWPENEQWCPHWQGIKAGLRRLGVPSLFVSCRPTLNIDSVVAFDPDLVIYGLMDIVKNAHWRAEIRQRLPSATIVMWYGDFRDDRMNQPDADCSELDAMFVSNDAQEKRYSRKWKMKKVNFLPLGCEPIDKPQVDSRYAFDFVFIGGQIQEGAFHDRASFVETMKIKSDLVLVNSYDPAVRSRIYRAMPKIYSSSKMALDVSHFTNIKKYTSIRYWEIPAFFGFALTKRWPGCEEFYPENSRIYFDTMEEAIEKKDYYLKHEPQRQAILKRAHALSYNHSYDHRLNQMFGML